MAYDVTARDYLDELVVLSVDIQDLVLRFLAAWHAEGRGPVTGDGVDLAGVVDAFRIARFGLKVAVEKMEESGS